MAQFDQLRCSIRRTRGEPPEALCAACPLNSVFSPWSSGAVDGGVLVALASGGVVAPSSMSTMAAANGDVALVL